MFDALNGRLVPKDARLRMCRGGARKRQFADFLFHLRSLESEVNREDSLPLYLTIALVPVEPADKALMVYKQEDREWVSRESWLHCSRD